MLGTHRHHMGPHRRSWFARPVIRQADICELDLNDARIPVHRKVLTRFGESVCAVAASCSDVGRVGCRTVPR
jgi:hypothetical protein